MLKNLLLAALALIVAALLIQRRLLDDSARSTSSTSAPSAAPSIAALLSEAARDPALAGAAIGFCLLDDQGRVRFEQHGRTAFIPASSLKTLTTATALEILGPDFRFQTELRSAAPPQDGTLHGDLILLGGGDPTLTAADIEALAAQAHQAGLRRITGRVRGDASLFHGSIYNDHWNWGDIGNGYGSPVCGLNVDHNRFTLHLSPGPRPGTPATIHERTYTQAPAGFRPQFQNDLLTGAPGSGDGVIVHGGEKTGILRLRGTVPPDRGIFTVQAAIPDPEHVAAGVLAAALRARGIDIGGLAPPPASTDHVLAAHRSAPLIDIIIHAHAESDNHETECLFRLLGVEARRPPFDVIRDHWRQRGLDFTGLRMEDGCGLARADAVTPCDLARLQHLARTGPHGEAYSSSLVGEGPVRGKAGAMSGVRSFTGFVTSRHGRTHGFAFIVNHATDTDAVARLRQRLLQALTDL